jgi:hypothetical protein
MLRESDEETLGDNHQQNGQNEQNGHADGGGNREKGNKQGSGPVGFWNPALKKVRNEVFKNWAITSMSSSYHDPDYVLEEELLQFSCGAYVNAFFQP